MDTIPLPPPSRSDHLSSRGLAMQAVCIIFLVFSWFSVALRLYVRQVMIQSLGADDWFMVVTLMMFTVFAANLLNLVAYGAGDVDPPLQNINVLLKYLILSECFYIVAIIFLKISFSFFLLRVVIRKWHSVVVWTTLAICTTYGIFYIFIAIFQCGNPTKILINKEEGKCLSPGLQVGLLYAQTAINTASDVVFAALPGIILWGANMERRAKVGAWFVLAIGACGSIASVCRFIYTRQLVASHSFFYANDQGAMLAAIEVGLGIVAASFATIRPLLRCCFARVRKGYARYGEGYMPQDSEMAASNPFSRASEKVTPRVEVRKTEGGKYELFNSRPGSPTNFATITQDDSKPVLPPLRSNPPNRSPPRPKSVVIPSPPPSARMPPNRNEVRRGADGRFEVITPQSATFEPTTLTALPQHQQQYVEQYEHQQYAQQQHVPTSPLSPLTPISPMTPGYYYNARRPQSSVYEAQAPTPRGSNLIPYNHPRAQWQSVEQSYQYDDPEMRIAPLRYQPPTSRRHTPA